VVTKTEVIVFGLLLAFVMLEDHFWVGCLVGGCISVHYMDVEDCSGPMSPESAMVGVPLLQYLPVVHPNLCGLVVCW